MPGFVERDFRNYIAGGVPAHGFGPARCPGCGHDFLLDSARLTPAELKVEIAVSLYAQGRLAIGKARDLAGMSLWEFFQLLGTRGVHSHFETADLGGEVAALRQLGRP